MAGKGGNDDWIIDSGCTEHITRLSDILENKEITPFEKPVIIPNGESIPVRGKGNCRLTEEVKLNGVLSVTNFKCNLLSVSRITNDVQCAVTFFPNFCVMQGLCMKNLIGAGKREGGCTV